jgi:hypothetical protein
MLAAMLFDHLLAGFGDHRLAALDDQDVTAPGFNRPV